MEFLNSLKEKISEDKIFVNEPMKKHTSFKIGGTADFYVKISTLEDLKEVLKLVKDNNIPFYVMGNGSNILVKDGGIRGIVIKIELEDIKIYKDSDFAKVTVSSGTLLSILARKLQKEGISGFEFATGIPGSIGGAVRINAGAYGSEMKDIVISSKYIDIDGNIHMLSNIEHKFSYRYSTFCDEEHGIILETTLKLPIGNSNEIELKMKELSDLRKEKQPINYPSAGSTFKRGNDFVTAQLIDACGLKGYSIGGAEVSTKHAGFIINKNNASAKDVIALIEYIKAKVIEKFDKDINLEVEILGEE